MQGIVRGLFAPHMGRTLKNLNNSIEDRISDHSPVVVDLPLGEPPVRKTRRVLAAPWQ